MMVPRSFLYTSLSSPQSSALTQAQNKKVGSKSRKGPRNKVERKGHHEIEEQTKTLTTSPPTPSQPVVIPTRSRASVHRRNNGKSLSIRTDSGRNKNNTHDVQSIPPSVAALLAITSLPDSKHRSYAGTGDASIHRLDASAQAGSSRSYSSSSLNPDCWGVLLSPPNELEQDNLSIASDATLDPLSSARSLSSESMPSLEADIDSSASVSGPSTPVVPVFRRYDDRNPRIIPLAMSQECHLNHPLLLIASDSEPGLGPEPPPDDGDIDTISSGYLPFKTSKALFKSNLTASLQKLKSAAASISSITALTIHRDDYLAQSVLSIFPQFAEERRPLPSAHVSDPVPHRYLNQVTVPPTDFCSLHDQMSWDKCTASIQMQTVQKGEIKSQNATAPPIFVSHPLSLSFDDLYRTSSPRQREPRENCDFLRVIVLEMNMRKNGKLPDTAPGRAKLWLPARQVSSQPEATEAGTPKRWISVDF